MIKVRLILLTIGVIKLTSLNEIFAEYQLSEVFQTDKGPIQGVILKTIVRHKKFSAFKGIPYAKPPIGRRRFRPPEEIDPWDDILIATNTSSVCPQYDYDNKTSTGDEDCLYLNVYTPKLKADDTELRPVMVWIYGGAFIQGYINASRYGPDFILEQNVVVVAMSYRLGALGFLALETKNATGNAGLKDQNFALRWVNKNIKNFGGDPNLVTIFGQSAGSVAVQLHKLSPMSRGLFSRSIAMSGSPLNVWGVSVHEQAVLRGRYLARKLGIVEDTDEKILEKLYDVPVEQIIVVTSTELEILDLPFKPSIEDPKYSSEPFISECIVKMYEAGNFSDEPHILGFVSSETVSFADSVASFLRVLNSALDTVVNITGIETIANIIQLRHLVNSTLNTFSEIGYDTVYTGIDVTTDLLFIAGIDRTQQYLAKGKGPVYYYRNSFDYPQALHRVRGNQLNGTAHSDDIAHVFWVSDRNQTTDPNVGITHQRSKMVRMWTNLARYGNPTPNGTDDPLLNITWPNSGEDGTHLEINTEYSIGPRPISSFIQIIRTLVSPLRLLIEPCPFMKLYELILLNILSMFSIGVNARLTEIVSTDKGPVQGEIRQTFRNSMLFSSFRGIRYGKPPVGYLRFKPPEEAERWREIFVATSEATPCPHLDIVNHSYVGEEDCLNLNVYTPRTNFAYDDDELFPVMVWLHGGGFKSGAANMSVFGPDFLVENKVVVVVINYRIGALGFLALNHTNATGNAGLKDQLLALKWVNKNIDKFGGDPNLVTLFGHSAGAVSIDYHVLSEVSKDFFHQSISMSGSHLCKWGFFTLSEAESQAFKLGEQLGIITDKNKEKLLTALYEKSPHDLVEATRKIDFIDLPFKPTMEDPIVAGDTAFISQCPIDVYKSDGFRGLPHMLGFAKDEAVSIAPGNKWLSVKKLLNNAIKERNINRDSNFWKRIYSKMIINISEFFIENISRAAFVIGIDLKRKLLKKYSNAPVYYYRISFSSNVSIHKKLHHVHMDGAAHEDELAYIWYVSYLDYPKSPEDPFTIVQERVTLMWTNFAKFGHPTPFGYADSQLNITWPISGIHNKFLDIDNKLSIKRDPTDVSTDIISGLFELFVRSNKCPIIS
ncbi:uncharacterized protein [Chelonus insularis]|uniref:uncharacterized protein n=1 Tax=Chelonus insularis TaxID=460826 RepID=UPI00158DD6AA|nr:uncharacterized protein LOC118068321 [Chelonus insularis]